MRCLRSYYCSRQCQNVSWHIVHKHVCYKPARFWWSVVVYSVGGVLAVPGVLKVREYFPFIVFGLDFARCFQFVATLLLGFRNPSCTISC